MPEQALYLKWRPTAFEDIVGQEHIVRTLRNSLSTGRIRHAYLFSGPRGTGKTTSARLLAKAVNCTHPDPSQRPCNECHHCVAINENRYLDLIEIDAATHTGVDDVRDLRDKIAFAPAEGQYKVYIIDEVHRFTGNAFDALLKTLEEPPNHAIFVLATTEIDRVPSTIKSRCLQFEFRRVSTQEVANRLEEIATTEGLNIDRAALEEIARQGTGSVRDSISLLDQIVTDPNEHITLALTQEILGTASSSIVREVAQALIDRDLSDGLRLINEAVDMGSDPRQFGQQMVEYLRALLMTQTGGAELVKASADDQALLTQQAQGIERGRLIRATRAFNEAVTSFRGGWQPQLSLELAFIESNQASAADESTAPSSAPAPIDMAAVRQLVASEIAHLQSEGAITTAQQAAAEPNAQLELDDVDLPDEVRNNVAPVMPLATMRQRWLDIQRTAKNYSQSLPALLDHAKPVRINGNVVVVGVPNIVFLEKLNTSKQKRVLRRVLEEVFTEKFTVHCLVVDEDQLNALDGGEIIEEEVEADPLVSFGQELGGQIKRRDPKTETDD